MIRLVLILACNCIALYEAVAGFLHRTLWFLKGSRQVRCYGCTTGQRVSKSRYSDGLAENRILFTDFLNQVF